MIKVTNLSRQYGDFYAVSDVSFSIQRGEIVGLLGHNGAGKSTIMKMLTGYLEPTSGTIEIDSSLVTPGKPPKAHIGYLPENCPVWPEMTVIDYLGYQAALHGIDKARRNSAVIQALRRTELKEKASASISTLSRGYRQRVGVAQAILNGPDIIILDEPTNGLDPTQIRHMRDLIKELAQHATVILSTHILQEVQAVCERVLILRNGQLLINSRLDELQQSDALILTIGSPAESLLSNVDGVTEVTLLEGADKFRYRLVAPVDSAPRIASALAASRVNLFELRAEHYDLESLFAHVNQHATEATPYA